MRAVFQTRESAFPDSYTDSFVCFLHFDLLLSESRFPNVRTLADVNFQLAIRIAPF